MALKQMILKDTAGGAEFVLPVTPENFSVSFGRNVLKVNVHQLGDVNLWARGSGNGEAVRNAARF